MARLIDIYSGGVLVKGELEPRIAHLKERRRALENESKQVNDEALTYSELQLIVGRLEEFAAKVHTRLNDMDFMTKRELIRVLVKRVEINNEQVNAVFRVGSTPTQTAPGENLQDCRRRPSVFSCKFRAALRMLLALVERVHRNIGCQLDWMPAC
jgi:site-specific DNA recombinase